MFDIFFFLGYTKGMKNTDSLKKNRDFKNVFSRGKWLRGKYLVIYILENGLNINRIGIAVGKKVGISVVRNRIKRVIRESYRANESLMNVGFDIILLWRNKDLKTAEFEKVCKDMAVLIKKWNNRNGDSIYEK